MSKETEQLSMLSEDKKTDNEPVVCLGMTFKDDEERRAYFSDELRKKLPGLKKREGFPLGEDEDIIALSDPPYYTACYNPWTIDLVAEWEASKPLSSEIDCLPYVVDVNEGKGDSIYNAHSYHTKVPHKAIMRYILHYTNPGDIVFDGFCGTGMTGVAASLCGNAKEVESLGYKVEENGNVIKNDDESNAVSKLGKRHAVLSDLSPMASFIAYNYNTVEDIDVLKEKAINDLNKVEEMNKWMYLTLSDKKNDKKLKIINEIWYCNFR